MQREIMKVPPAQSESWEFLMHKSGATNKYLLFNNQIREKFSTIIGDRAIGVVYRPEYEHFGNYVPLNMGKQYDAFIFFDKTNALHPLVLENTPL
jgi:erythromycin esterase-like protein